MKRIHFFNERMHQNNETKKSIINVDETILEYNQVFTSKIKLLPSEPQLPYFDHLPQAMSQKQWFATICYN